MIKDFSLLFNLIRKRSYGLAPADGGRGVVLAWVGVFMKACLNEGPRNVTQRILSVIT